MDERATVRPGLRETLRRLVATVLAILQNRFELLEVELQEERVRLFDALLFAAAVAVLGIFTLAMATFALAVVAWDRFGVPGLFVLSGVGFVSTLFAYWQLRVHLKNWPLLPGTLAELKKDRECLEHKS